MPTTKTILIFNAILWGCYGILEHASHIAFGENHWQGSLFSSGIIYIFCNLYVFLFQQLKDSEWLTKVLVLTPVVFVSFLIWHNLTRILHYQITFQELLSAPPLFWVAGASYNAILLTAWAALFIGAQNYLKNKQQQIEILSARSQLKDAQLKNLRNQLNPHFLFNVLNSLDAAILQRQNEQAHQMLLKLSEFLRNTLLNDGEDKITVKRELKLIEDYIDIERARFGDALDAEFNIDVTAEALFIPPLLLQPLVENAIKYSESVTMNRKITVEISLLEGKLSIEITNPISANQQTIHTGTQTGLTNIASRLKALYGNEASLRTTESNGVFHVKLRLPIERGVE